jgi:hypothetical protein
MLIRQRHWQEKLQNLPATHRQFCGCFNFLVFCENFGSRQDLFLAPHDQVGSPLRYAAFLCVPDKIIESIQGALQLSIGKHAGQARHRQRQKQHEYEYGEDNLYQRKTAQPLHRRTYSIEAESQQGSGRRSKLFLAPTENEFGFCRPSARADSNRIQKPSSSTRSFRFPGDAFVRFLFS